MKIKNNPRVFSLPPLSSIIFFTIYFSMLAPIGTVVAEDVYVFSAPPRESVQVGKETYQPIADFLTKVTGKKFEYQHPSNWLRYSADMRKDKYDLVFDGPHFVSWRLSRIQHTPLVKIPGDFIFVFLTQKENEAVNEVDDLIGKKVCGHAPPNQGTLRLFNQLSNPLRQPLLVEVKGWRNIYKAMMAGKCSGAIVPLKIYKQMDPNKKDTRVLLVTKAAPGQAFTAGPRISFEDKAKIIDALMTPEGQKATEKLRTRFPTKAFTKANKSEYQGIDILLQFSWGFFS